MRAVIVYESMFGNTHAIADAIGNGLEPMLEVVVVPLAEAGRERLGDADLLVVGGAHPFSRHESHTHPQVGGRHCAKAQERSGARPRRPRPRRA
jgi:flavodoxin